ncbi:C1GALT1-specific chaperone 1-like protein [Lycorma delicatula]|uniref:C1GALT1-specific chaperone 1-like protein n=1 Tax=Lycorma delicatula TaxID=130591 RepID=UPI003F50DF65
MIRVKIIFAFILGFAIGVVLAILVFFSNNFTNDFSDQSSLNKAVFPLKYNHKNVDSFEKIGLIGNKYRSLMKKKAFKPNYKSNILCVIFSSDLSNSFAASKSWAKHCNNYHLIGMDDGTNNSDNFKYLNVTVFKPKHSWHFLCDSILFLYKLYKKTIQWVIFVHDDVFVIPENLRYYVIYKDYNKPYYLGDLSCFWSTYYNTAEAGFVLSRGAIKLLIKKFNTTQKCESSGKHWKAEDYYLGKHLAVLDVHPEDTRDSKGRGRFHTFTPEQLYSPGNSNLLTKYFRRRVYPNIQGPNCCSDKTITFQGTSQHRIFFYYYLLYFLKPYVLKGNNPNNLSRTYVPSPHVWKKFITDEFGENVDLDTVDADKYYMLWLNKISPDELNAILRKEASGKPHYKLFPKVKNNLVKNDYNIL